MASVLINNETMLRTSIAIATLISVSLPAGAEIYKCRLPNGKTEISNVPCPSGSGTVVARPDEPVSESSRRAAEQDVERMRNYVEKREAAQRADEAAQRDEQRAASQQSRNSAQRPAQQYGNAQECARSKPARHDGGGLPHPGQPAAALPIRRCACLCSSRRARLSTPSPRASETSSCAQDKIAQRAANWSATPEKVSK